MTRSPNTPHSSGPIAVGDLVVVVRWPCCKGDIGHTFVVAGLETRPDVAHCGYCGATGGHTGMHAKARRGDGGLYPLEFLKRIPPLGELEGEDTKEDLREPA